MSTDSFKASAAFDRKIAWRGGGSVRHLVVELEAGERAGEPAPLNLAIALDVSGSMHGDKIETAKAAALGIVEGLRPVERLAVSVFSSEGRLILAGTAMDEKGRTAARSAVVSLQADGNTNLSEGWLIAVEAIAAAAPPGAVSRVVILTDGQANAGIIDESELAAHAAALRRRGVSTSTVGIGDGYAEGLLRAIASEGGGLMHDAEKAHEIEEVMRGELDELRGIALEEVTVALLFPPAVKVECLSAMPCAAEPGRARIFAGSMAAGRRREVVLRVRLPQGEEGSQAGFDIEAGAKIAGSGEALAARLAAHLTLAAGARNNAQSRDDRLAAIVMRAWHAHVVQLVSTLNRRRDWRQAEAWLDRAIPHFAKYTQDLPGGAEKLQSLVILREKVGRVWNERARKELEFAAFAESRSQVDYRSAKRKGYFEDL